MEGVCKLIMAPKQGNPTNAPVQCNKEAALSGAAFFWMSGGAFNGSAVN